MSNNLIQLDEFRPHVCLQTPDGNAHVVPKSFFDAVVNGEKDITELDDYCQITRAIVRQWLESLERMK